MKYFSIIVLALFLFKSNAQSVLVPAADAFVKARIKNDEYRTGWYITKDTARKKVGTITTQVIKNKNELIVITKVNLERVPSQWTDSTVDDLNTLRPIYHSSQNMQRNMQLKFGKVVTGFYFDKAKGTDTVISDTTASDYFDSNLYPYLITLLPLHNGYTKDIAIYDYNPARGNGVMKAYVKNVKSGTYQNTKSGTRNVWIVNTTDDIAHDNSTYFIDKETFRTLKQDVELDGQKIEMIAEENE